jgi:hypothetical protein
VRKVGNIEQETALICVQNALKLAYVHLSVQTNFRWLIPWTAVFKEEGREGKREGGIRRNGMGMRRKER